MPKNRRNVPRILERVQWSFAAFNAVLAVVNIATSNYQVAATNLAGVLLCVFAGLYFRDEAFLADHDAVVRVYRNGRLRSQLPLNLAPGRFLAQVEVAIGYGCTCGEHHTDTETVVREPHKDEL